MSSDQSAQLRERGIAAAKARRNDEARQLLQGALRLNPRDEVAWLYLAGVSSDKKERLLYLQKVLEINPNNELGIKAVEALGITPEQLLNARPASTPTRPPDAPAKPLPSIAPKPVIQTPVQPPIQAVPDYLADLDDLDDEDDDQDFDAPAIPSYLQDLDDEDTDLDDDEFGDPFGDEDILQPARPTQAASPTTSPTNITIPASTGRGLPTPPPLNASQPGVPIPDENYLREVLLYIEPMIAEYSAPPVSDIEWIHKEKNRAGERDIIGLRLQIAAAALAALIVLGGVGLLIVYNVPEVRRVVFAATRTPTLTPSNTPTATPGFTPTPSATLDTTRFPTYTPSATIPFTLTPFGNVNVTPRPTELDLPVQPDRPIIDSARLISEGQYAEAIPTLQAERQASGTVYNPNAYYFEALALALSGEFQDALNLMLEAEDGLTRVSSTDVTRYRPLVNLGFAEVFVAQALDALARNSGAEAGQRLTEARSRLEEAITLNPRVARAYVLLAQTYALQGEYPAAIAQLDSGLLLPELASDVPMLLEKGWTYLAEGRSLLRSGSLENAQSQFEKADYQAFYTLYLNPYDQTAHRLRIESALARDLPGLAVLYTQTYLFYHPDNAVALRYLGDARTAEGNLDLAFNAYDQALSSGEVSVDLVDALLSRAELYESERRYDLALADYNRALEANSENTAIQARRMQVAYAAGDLDTALADSEALLGSGAVSDDELRLMQAWIIVDRADRGERDSLSDALELLNSVNDGVLTPDIAAIANDYRTSIHFQLENYEEALNAVNAAISLVGDSGTRRYLRGQISEALGDFANAARDYEWVVTWNEVYGYAFAEDALGRLAEVRQQQGDANLAATQTAEATITPTAQP